MPDVTRPTKKQKEMLDYIEAFITQHGYSPSYREIRSGLGYNSVATVALHISNLVSRGHLVKRENAARTLEPTHRVVDQEATGFVKKTDAAWLFEHIESRLKQLEAAFDQSDMNDVYVLVGAVKVLGYTDQAVAYIHRIRRVEDAQ